MFDVVLSTIFLIVFLPFLVLISFLIVLDSKGGIFYLGERAGHDNNSFKMYKFRTMVINAEQLGGPSSAVDDPRFTKIGRFLRKYKLDELPQFWNVLIGDMSIVGPRPQVLFYTNQYSECEKAILSVRPGITDLASLYFSDMDAILGSGDVDTKYATEIEPLKNKLRLKYVNNMSFFLDSRIIIETFFNVIGIKNITKLDLSVE